MNRKYPVKTNNVHTDLCKTTYINSTYPNMCIIPNYSIRKGALKDAGCSTNKNDYY